MQLSTKKSLLAAGLCLLVASLHLAEAETDSLSKKIASTGINRQRAPPTDEQQQAILRLGEMRAQQDELADQHREILNQFDPSTAKDKLRLKKLDAQLRANSLLMGRELGRLELLTKAQLDAEQAAGERPPGGSA